MTTRSYGKSLASTALATPKIRSTTHYKWALEILDQGRYRAGRKPIWQKDEAGNDVVGMQVSDPVPLDGAGEPLVNPTPATAKYRTFDVYKEKTFTIFNF